MIRSLLAALALLFCATAEGAAYENEVLRIEIPAGFEGPVRYTGSAPVTSVAFVKRHHGDRGTLLQISTHALLAEGPKLNPQERGLAAEKCLLAHLGAIQRRRDSFEASKPIRVDLSGLSAAKSAWKGIAQGLRMFGTTYCVIVGSQVVILHTQDFEDGPPDNTSDAIKSFESIEFKPSN